MLGRVECSAGVGVSGLCKEYTGAGLREPRGSAREGDLCAIFVVTSKWLDLAFLLPYNIETKASFSDRVRLCADPWNAARPLGGLSCINIMRKKFLYESWLEH